MFIDVRLREATADRIDFVDRQRVIENGDDVHEP